MTPESPRERREPERVRIDADNAGRRVDVFLRQLLPHLSLASLMKWLRRGMVRVNGRRALPSARLALGDVVSVPAGLLAPGQVALPPAAGELDILFEDDDLLVIAKPAGLAVHAGTGHEADSLQRRVVAYLGAAALAPGRRPGAPQRLDRDVSGIVVLGKNAPALRALTEAVAAGTVDKVYVALVDGRVEAAAGHIDLPLAIADEPRRDRPRTRPDAAGARAETEYRVVERLALATLLEVRIRTGRQHQIRAHLRSLGHSITGDARYGGSLVLGLARPFLHAARVTLAHPRDGRALAFEAPLPAELARVLAALRAQGGHRPG